MATKKFDDEAVVKEAIATSPDITPGEAAATPTASKSRKAVDEPLQPTPEDLEREASRGRLFAGGMSQVCKTTLNQDFTDDQVNAATELGQMMFKNLREAQAPGWVHGAILGTVLVLPFVPLIYRLVKPEPKPTGEVPK